MEPLSDDPTSRPDAEDTFPTTERELRGWFSCGLAAEIFAVCGVGSFLPVTLEQLARERGVLFSDRSTLCVEKPSEDAATMVQSYKKAIHSRDNIQCVVRPFGKDMTTASFAMYTFSIAVIVQALCLVSFSSFADHGSHRKRLLLAFGFIGSTATMLFLLVSTSVYMLGPLLVIIGVTCLGSSFVLLNSYLPLLVSNHPSIRNGGRTGSEGVFMSHSTANGTNSDELPTKQRELPESQLSTKISSKGVGIGYCAAVLVQCLSIVLLYIFSLLPIVQRWGVGGLQKPWEIYPLAFIHGFVMGGLSSYCRSFFGLLIPPGHEAAFYALYAVTDKGSSAIGPAIVGAIVDKTGTIRPAFGFLAILIAVPGPLIWLIDVERGNNDAVMFQKGNRATEINTYQLLDRSAEGDQEAEALLTEDG
ncbi:MAG: hypothetical protein Q9195_007785 [Heterodermia aff. obscurata]